MILKKCSDHCVLLTQADSLINVKLLPLHSGWDMSAVCSESPGQWTHYSNMKRDKSTRTRYFSVDTSWGPRHHLRGEHSTRMVIGWETPLCPCSGFENPVPIWPNRCVVTLSQIYSLLTVSRPLIKYFDVIELISQSDGYFLTRESNTNSHDRKK